MLNRQNISPLYRDVTRGRGGIAGGKFLFVNDSDVTSYIVNSGTARGTVTYLSLAGASGDYASTPDSAALDITGDISFIFYIAPTLAVPETAKEIITKSKFGNQRSYYVQINPSGGLRIGTSPDGIDATIINVDSNVILPISNGQGIWALAIRDVNNGAGGNDTKFYTSSGSPFVVPSFAEFTQLGTTDVVAGTTSIFNGTANLEVGSSDGGITNNFSGKIYRAQVYDGIFGAGGTLVADFNANDWTSGATLVSSSTAETYTLNGTATIQGASGVNAIRLATTASSTNDVYNNMAIVLTGGTGSGQNHQRITDYDGVSKVAVLSGAWITEPDSTSVYQIVDRDY